MFMHFVLCSLANSIILVDFLLNSHFYFRLKKRVKLSHICLIFQRVFTLSTENENIQWNGQRWTVMKYTYLSIVLKYTFLRICNLLEYNFFLQIYNFYLVQMWMNGYIVVQTPHTLQELCEITTNRLLCFSFFFFF